MKTKEKVEQGKGNADPLMPLGYLLDKSMVVPLTRYLYEGIYNILLSCIKIKLYVNNFLHLSLVFGAGSCFFLFPVSCRETSQN